VCVYKHNTFTHNYCLQIQYCVGLKCYSGQHCILQSCDRTSYLGDSRTSQKFWHPLTHCVIKELFIVWPLLTNRVISRFLATWKFLGFGQIIFLRVIIYTLLQVLYSITLLLQILPCNCETIVTKLLLYNSLKLMFTVSWHPIIIILEAYKLPSSSSSAI
jgi:hypothetical protein